MRTVPNVFIGGKHIGGCDSKATLPQLLFFMFSLLSVTFYLSLVLCLAAVMDKHRSGQLVPLLNDAGAIANNSAQL